MIVLDTDHLTIWERQRAHPDSPFRRRLESYSPDDVATTIVSYEEQTRGWMSYLKKSPKIAHQIDGYERLNRQLRLYCSVQVLGFDPVAATEFQRLKSEHRRLGSMDLKIAAICLAQKATLVTRNTKDFQPIPELRLENWLA